MPNTVLICGKATRFSAHSLSQIPVRLASFFKATAKQTLRGMIWGSTNSEELKIRTT